MKCPYCNSTFIEEVEESNCFYLECRGCYKVSKITDGSKEAVQKIKLDWGIFDAND